MLSDTTLQEIVKHIDENIVDYIISPTGSGKSTLVPPEIIKEHPKEKIVTGVPTVTAAISISRQVKKNNPKIKVEYAAGGEVHYNKDTQLIYSTYGHLRNKLKKYFNKGIARNVNDIDNLIIDEAHIRNVDADMLMMLWEQLYIQKVKVPKLIFMSATPSIEALPVNPEPVPFIVKTTPNRVKVEYITDKIKRNKPDLERIKNEVIKQHARFDISLGSILIFVPGVGEVIELAELLSGHKTMNVILAYGNMDKKEVDKIFEPDVANQRKIIIATNICESAITIDNLLVVIDSMFERVNEVSQTGVNRLVLQLISKDSSDQRKGRTGRKKRNIEIIDEDGVTVSYDGFLIRIISELDYFSLPDSKVPEIERISIDSEVIDIISIGLDPKKVFPKELSKKIDISLAILRKIKAITNKKDNNEITKLGQFIADLPLSVRSGACIWYWIYQLKQPAFPCIVLTTLIDNFGPSYFWYPPKNMGEDMSDYQRRVKHIVDEYHSRFIGRDDLCTLLNLWQAMAKETGSINPSPGAMVHWCNNNHINNKKMREFTNLLTQVYDMVLRKDRTLEIELGPFDSESVVNMYNIIAAEIYSEFVLVSNDRGRYTNGKDTYMIGSVKNSVPKDIVTSKKILAISLFSQYITLYSDLVDNESESSSSESESSSEEDFFSDEE